MSDTRRTQAAAAMRSHLVAAAVDQIADEGMRGLTHRKVESRAGVSQGLVKYHFGSLDGLIAAVVEHLTAHELGEVLSVDPAQQAAVLATGRIPDELWRNARQAVDRLTAHPRLLRARYELFLHSVGRPDLQRVLREGRERFVDAVASGLPGAADPRAAARMVLALVDGLLLHQLSVPDDDLDALAPAFLLAVGSAALVAPLERHPRAQN